MLKHIPKLRLRCKGNLDEKFNLRVQRVGKKICTTIPVLGIFALVGITIYSTMIFDFGETGEEVYAAESTSATSALTISNTSANTATDRKQVAYSSHNVRVQASSIGSYALTITGPTKLTGTTTINGAGGKKGSAMTDNTWGYGWDNTTTTNANITYNSFTGSAQTLDGDAVSNGSVDFTKKLAFAAKFGQSAAEGHYTASVTLNLTLNPKVVTTYKIIFDCNGGTGCPTDAGASTDTGTRTYTIPWTPYPSKEDSMECGWHFDGYYDSVASKAYDPGDTITQTPANAQLTLQALWFCEPNGINVKLTSGNLTGLSLATDPSVLHAEEAAVLTAAIEAVKTDTAEFLEGAGITQAVVEALANTDVAVEDLVPVATFLLSATGEAAKEQEEYGSIEVALRIDGIKDGDEIVTLVLTADEIWEVVPSVVKNNYVIGTYTELGAVVVFKADDATAPVY